MQKAEIVLTIIRKYGEKGLPLERVYRLLFNKELYLRVYAELYPNKGAMTKGIGNETVDGMSLEKIEQLINELKYERYIWTPVKRTYMAKKNGKLRPLGIPMWKDKLLQEVIRMILEAYYEPQFSNYSHGFRPARGCHTALQMIQSRWTGTRWFIEGDISKYFDTIDHPILLNILGEKLKDNRLLLLIKNLLKAGYMEDWKYNKTLSGTPQGGVLSPLLSNIYLNKFDQYIEQKLIPDHTEGKVRADNKSYKALAAKIYRLKKIGKTKEVKQLQKQLKELPSKHFHQQDYRRLRYVRYADDFLLGFDGPKCEAEGIKEKIGEWLNKELKLTLSEEKTLITHARTKAARFLNYEIVNQQGNDQRDFRSRRSINGIIGLQVPKDVVKAKCDPYMKNGKPTQRAERMHDDDFSIITQYQQEYRGIVQYYLLAYDVRKLGKLHYIMKSSLLKTLANKHQMKTTAIANKHQARVFTPEGKALVCLQVKVQRDGKEPLIAQFGGIALKRHPKAILDDLPPIQRWSGRTEIIERLLAQKCELCGTTENIEVHHIGKMSDLKSKSGRQKPEWMKTMIARQRKTLVVCRECHHSIHNGETLQLNVA
jgi:group II intron reverse transcriptase/maturase